MVDLHRQQLHLLPLSLGVAPSTDVPLRQHLRRDTFSGRHRHSTAAEPYINKSTQALPLLPTDPSGEPVLTRRRDRLARQDRWSSGKGYQEWDSLTAKLAGGANLPFLLQLPHIILNARNLLAGNKTILFVVPWLRMLTGLLGNLSLMSYFAKQREMEVVIVHALGVISTYVVIQLAMAESMPLPQFVATSAVVAAGLLLKFLNYFGWLPASLWLMWEDFMTIGGLALLPQVMWSTFVPFIPNIVLPGIISGSLAVAAVVMARMGKLSEGGTKFVGSLSGWTATFLFMWMPVAQMIFKLTHIAFQASESPNARTNAYYLLGGGVRWTNYLNPNNINGLSAFSMLLAMIGNGLMIPLAVFIRDLMCVLAQS